MNPYELVCKSDARALDAIEDLLKRPKSAEIIPLKTHRKTKLEALTLHLSFKNAIKAAEELANKYLDENNRQQAEYYL